MKVGQREKLETDMLGQEINGWLQTMQRQQGYYLMCAHAYTEDLLDATSLAYDLNYMLGNNISESEKNTRKAILDSYQTGEDGFYYERNAEIVFKNSSIDRVLEMHGNYLTFQVIGAYKAINRLPEKKISFYDKYISDIGRYLEVSCPWERSPWGAGGMVDNLGTILKCNIDMGYVNYKRTVDEAIDWLNKKQDDDTGLWINRNNRQGINGLVNGGYHLMRGTYFLYHKPFDKAERIIDTIIEDIRTDVVFRDDKAHGCNDLDHFFLLQKCHELIPAYRGGEIMDIASHRKNIILNLLRCDDGGFSFWNDAAVKVHNYLDVSPGFKESDMQGTVFYLQTLISINKILGEENDKLRESLTHG